MPKKKVQTLTNAEEKAKKAMVALYLANGRSPRVEEVSQVLRRSHSWTARLLNCVVDKGHAEKDENRYQTIRPTAAELKEHSA